MDSQPADVSSAAVPYWLPRVEPELVRSSEADLCRGTAPNLPAVDAELVRSNGEDLFTPTPNYGHTVEPGRMHDSNGGSDGAGIEALFPAEAEGPSIATEEIAAIATEPLPVTEPESSSTATEEIAAVATEPLPPIEPENSLSVAERPDSQIGSPTGEWLRKKTLRPVRNGGSTDGYRHLTLSAKEESRLLFQNEPNGLAAEQFRMLRHTLGKEFESGAVLLVTSPAAGDGKTLTSVNLASCLAESGQPTLLIEADIRRPSVRQMLGSTIEPPGVEDVLARNVEPRRAVHGIQELNLYTAMVARVPDNPAQLIAGPGVKHLLAWARENFLWVVLDAPPVLPAADVSELLPFADGALLVIRAQSTPRELAKQAIDLLGKHLRGVVFNEVTVDSNPHYRYLNNYYPPQKSDSKAGLLRNKLT
jgi:capsular exopolysaccharide synthesis family protein